MTAEPMHWPEPAGAEIVMATLMRHAGGSGVQSHVRTFHDYLERSARPVSVVNPFSSRSPALAPVFGARFGIRQVSRPAGVWWYRHWHAHYLQRALSAHLAGRPRAVVYAQCPVSAFAAMRAATGQPIVMAAHFDGSQADEWVRRGELTTADEVYRSIRSFEERVLTELDGIVYVSAFTRARLERRIPALREIPGVVVPNPVPATSQPATGSAPIADLITVGALEPHKNHTHLLRILAAAARRGHRYSLTVVGDGPDRGRLEALARQLGLAEQVRFTGYQADPRRLMRAHRLYCHTSVMETFGIVLVEAMAEGLPVLAAPVGGVPEVVRPGSEGLFWPLDDVDVAAEVLVSLMQDPARRARMAAAAGARAAAEFSAEVVGSRLVSFLAKAEVRQESSSL